MKRILLSLCMIGLMGGLCAQCTSPAPTSDSPAPTTVAAPAKGKVIKISQAEFAKKIFNYNDPQALYTGKTPVVVDCYADWCGPCRNLAPIAARMAEKYKGRLIIYKINVDKAQDICEALDITSIPTLFFMKPNAQPGMMVGAPDESEFDQAIQDFLKQ